MRATAQQPSLQSNFCKVRAQHSLLDFTYAMTLHMSAAAQQPSLQSNFNEVGMQHALFRLILRMDIVIERRSEAAIIYTFFV